MPTPGSASGGITAAARMPFADVDDHHPQREHLALRAQRVRAAGVAAADLADVDAAVEEADEQAAEHGAERDTPT